MLFITKEERMYTPKDISELESKVIDMSINIKKNIQSFNAAEIFEMQCYVVEMLYFINSLHTALMERGMMELGESTQWHGSGGCGDYDYPWQDSGC